MNNRRLSIWSAGLLVFVAIIAAAWRTAPARAMTSPTVESHSNVVINQDDPAPTVTEVPANSTDHGGGDDGGGDDGGGDDGGGSDGGGGDDGPGHDGSDDDNGIHGKIDLMPTDTLTGTWVISGTSYTADEETKFDTEHGGFAIGVCVEVETDSSAPTVATQIQSESAYKCGGSDTDHDGHSEFDGEFFGEIVSLPTGPDFVGSWLVGTIAFTVTTETELVQEATPFTLGVLVKVHFTENNGQKVATEVTSKFASEDDGHDDNGDGSHDGNEGQAFGPIVTLPAGLIGVWDIAGIPYTVTAETRLDSEGVFTTGVNVKVEFVTNANDERIATEIEITDDNGGADVPGTFKFVGWVQVKPAGLVGAWTISGQVFTTTTDTVFDESKALLTSTSYVEVTYHKAGEQRIVDKLEAEVPPGAGEHDDSGKIEHVGDDSPNAASLNAALSVWRIGGNDYSVTPATNLNDFDAALTVGSTALVNSYSAPDGTQVATRIRALAIVSNVMIPILRR